MSKETLIYMIQLFENKLKELMTEQEFIKFTDEIGEKAFLFEVEHMKCSDDFKKFCKDNLSKITGRDEE